MKKLFICVFITLFVLSCSTENKEATLSIGITDAPVSSAESVEVTFTKIEIAKEGAEEGGWETYFEGSQAVDLLEFQNGNVFDFPDKNFDTGSYGQVRLFLSSEAGDNTITIDSVKSNLEYNAGVANTGFKLVGGFTIEEGVTTELTIDFDVRKSIVVKGGNNNPTYNLKPTVKLVQTNTTGNIKLANATADEVYFLYLSTTDVTGEEAATNDGETIPYFNAVISAIGTTEDGAGVVTFAFVPFETYKVYKGSYDTDGVAQALEQVNISENNTETVSISDSDASTVNFTIQ